MPMTLHEALNRVYCRQVEYGITAEYLLLREAIRQLTAQQVEEINQLNIPFIAELVRT